MLGKGEEEGPNNTIRILSLTHFKCGYFHQQTCTSLVVTKQHGTKTIPYIKFYVNQLKGYTEN